MNSSGPGVGTNTSPAIVTVTARPSMVSGMVWPTCLPVAVSSWGVTSTSPAWYQRPAISAHPSHDGAPL